ncbi:hypothetical protein Pst134EB_023664 [Puccinia striiformis f. sp. tritici]|nr:hypothetical protein Pst134EB_023664 [Puccinia striiformis f. sp. tritici]
MAQPSASSRPTTTLDSKPTQPKPQKDGAKTLVDAVTAYQRRTARAERTAARNQPTDSSSAARPSLHPRSTDPDPSSDTRPRPQASPRRNQDAQLQRRDQSESQQGRSAGSPFPSRKNPASNRRGLLTPNESNSKLFDPRLDSVFTATKASSNDQSHNEIRSSTTAIKAQAQNNNHTLKIPPGNLNEDQESSQSNLSQASQGVSKNPPPHMRSATTQERGWKQKKTTIRGSVAEPRQLFDPRKHDPVRFASSQRPTELTTHKNSMLTPSSNGDHDPTTPYAYSPGNTQDDPTNEDEDNKNDLVVNLKHAYKRIVSLETALKDEECAAKAKEEELRAREIREGLKPSKNSSASLLRNNAQQKRHQEEYWVKLSKQHRELAETHQQFLEMALDPRLPPSMHALPQKYNTPSRLWQIGFHQLLERLRHALPTSINSSLLKNEQQSSQLLLEHMTDFIYFAYGFYTALLTEQRLLPFKNVWIEQLGDLARYRMAVAGLTSKLAAAIATTFNPIEVVQPSHKANTRRAEQDADNDQDDDESESGRERTRPRARRPQRLQEEGEPSMSGSQQSSRHDQSSQEESRSSQQPAPSPPQAIPEIVPPRPGGSIGLAALGDWDCEEQEIWRATAKDWYAKGLADNPATGRLHHHLALLSKGDELKTLYHYCKSLTAAHPYLPARESILPFFEQEHQARRSRPEVSINDLFVHLHGMLFTKIQLDDFDSELARFMERLTEDRFLSDKQGRSTRGTSRQSGDIIAQSTMSNASWAMMGTVNISAILQYGLEDGVIRAAELNGPKSHDIRSRHNNHRATAKGGGKPAPIAPQAILLSHSAVNPPAEQRKPTHSISSEEGVPSTGNGLDSSNTDQFDEEHKAIMIKRAAVNEADEENDPVVFVWAAKFTFEIFKEVLQQNRSEDVCPYLTIILTFIASFSQNGRVMKKLERFIPWDRLVIYFNHRIPNHVQARNTSSSSTLTVQETSNPSSLFKLNGYPLSEDWCLRGMEWAVKGLFGRGYWRQQKSNYGKVFIDLGDPIRELSIENKPKLTPKRPFIPNLPQIESELEAIIRLDEELEAEACQQLGGNGSTAVHARMGRIDCEEEQEFEEWDDKPTSSSPSCADRLKRIAVTAGWIASSVNTGIKLEASPIRSIFTISNALKQKISRWENEAKLEEEERMLAKAKITSIYHQNTRFDEETDDHIDEDNDEEEEDDDDPDDSELVKSLKARRRELKMILNQTKNVSNQVSVNSKPAGRKSHSGSFQRKLGQPTNHKNQLYNNNKINVLPGYTTLVFDTNILIGMLSIVKEILESEQFTIIIPLVVITELDGLKKRINDTEDLQSQKLGEEAFEAITFLESSIKTYAKILKIQTSKGNYLRDLSIRNEQINFQDSSSTTNRFITTNTARNLDDVVLRATSWQLEHFSNRLPSSTNLPSSSEVHNDGEQSETPEKVVLLTLDRNLRLKARARGILAADEKQIIYLVKHLTTRSDDRTHLHRNPQVGSGSITLHSQSLGS